MDIKIDKHIPIPTSRYPFGLMEVGDSFFVETSEPALKLLSLKWIAEEGKLSIKFIVEAEKYGARIWRIK